MKDRLFFSILSFSATKEFSILAYQPNAQAASAVSFEQKADLPLPGEAGIIPLAALECPNAAEASVVTGGLLVFLLVPDSRVLQSPTMPGNFFLWI